MKAKEHKHLQGLIDGLKILVSEGEVSSWNHDGSSPTTCIRLREEIRRDAGVRLVLLGWSMELQWDTWQGRRLETWCYPA
jgi:hypothetical protein